jgi:Arc/MetJ-type ribon-helix-helix transcriptional regulator
MGSKVVPVRLIDELVRLGIYKSRSEALRDLIRIGAKHVEQIREIAKAVDKLFELEREEGDIPIRLEGALKQLLSGRERFR